MDSTTFPYGNIEKEASYSAFRGLLAQIPTAIKEDEDVVIFRYRDEQIVNANSRQDVASGGNLAVIIIPKIVIDKDFDKEPPQRVY